MPRYIDADKLHPDVMTNRGGIAISQGQIAKAPTEDVKPVLRAEWEERELHNTSLEDRKILVCSHCNIGIANGVLGHSNFCPNCGANMLGVKKIFRREYPLINDEH